MHANLRRSTAAAIDFVTLNAGVLGHINGDNGNVDGINNANNNDNGNVDGVNNSNNNGDKNDIYQPQDIRYIEAQKYSKNKPAVGDNAEEQAARRCIVAVRNTHERIQPLRQQFRRCILAVRNTQEREERWKKRHGDPFCSNNRWKNQRHETPAYIYAHANRSCRSCGGRGVYRYHTCERCDGRGVIDGHKTCWKCYGESYILIKCKCTKLNNF